MPMTFPSQFLTKAWFPHMANKGMYLLFQVLLQTRNLEIWGHNGY